VQWRNPVMFVVYVGSILTTLLWLQALSGQGEAPSRLHPGHHRVAVVHGAVRQLRRSHGRRPQQGAGGVAARAEEKTWAKKLRPAPRRAMASVQQAENCARATMCAGRGRRHHPAADGEVIEGVASVDESAITGESAPVIRESGGDFSAVTGGTRVLSDWLVVRITVNPGESFLDRMIAMVEGAKRQKTPNEIALTILLVALTIVFLVVTVTLLPFSMFSVEPRAGQPVSITVLVALLVCLIPTTIGGLLSAIGVAGMSRMMQANVIATSGRAVEAAGDVDVLLLDKTGTITLGNRQASGLPAGAGRDRGPELADARSSPRWPTRRPKAAASSCWPSRSSAARARRGPTAPSSCPSPRRPA
jgi:K+-transporting ATPase ATPase B chain